MSGPIPGFGGLIIASGSVDISLTLRASATASDTGTITIPGTIQANDLGVLFMCAYADNDSDDASVVNNVTPSGWTNLGSDTDSSINPDAAAVRVVYKKLTALDASASVTVMTGDGETDFSRAILLVFSPGVAGTPTYTPSTFTVNATTGNPGSQSAAASGHGPPTIVVGFACGPSGSTGAFSTASPAWDGTVTAGTEAIAGYKLYATGSTPASHTVDMNDLGSINFLAAGYFVVT